MVLLQSTTTLLASSGERHSFSALYFAGDHRQLYSCNAPPHCLGAVGSGSLAEHCRSAREQWAVVLW